MDRATELRLLNTSLRILARSLLQYTAEVALLHIQDGRDKAIAEVVAELCAVEEDVDLDLVDVIEARGGGPMPGQYSLDYTSCNYIRWSSVLDGLVEEIERHQHDLRELARTFGADAVVEPILSGVLEARRPYVDRLRDLQRDASAAA